MTAAGRRSFAHRAETFGFDTPEPWALGALRLLFHVPRAYEPLVEAWEIRNPGTLRALERLVTSGFVEVQEPVVIDTRTGALSTQPTRAVHRWRTTTKGRKLLVAAREDSRILEDAFPHLSTANLRGVMKLLHALDLDDSHAKFGLSSSHAAELCGLPERSTRWWIKHLTEKGMLRQLPVKYSDVREVIPRHWRATRLLCRQLDDVLTAFPGQEAFAVDFRLKRTRFLGDIDPARVGISGATDFDHDIEMQRILAAMLRSPRCAQDGVFTAEPRLMLPVNTRTRPWRFEEGGNDGVFYQPDAELRERDGRTTVRSIVEYERYQSRKDAWSHIERFLGYLHTRTFPFEAATLRFVVDSDARLRGYVQLIEAFADYAMDNGGRMPRNTVTLSVSSVPRLLAASDPLDPRSWYRICLPSVGADTERGPVLHSEDESPYREYFTRG